MVVASSRTEPHADRANHRIQSRRWDSEVGSVAAVAAGSGGSFSTGSATGAMAASAIATVPSRRDIQAASEHRSIKSAYRVDHNCACRCDDTRGSMRKGKLSRATNEAKFEIAKR